jgi:hypothetical protein
MYGLYDSEKPVADSGTSKLIQPDSFSGRAIFFVGSAGSHPPSVAEYFAPLESVSVA